MSELKFGDLRCHLDPFGFHVNSTHLRHHVNPVMI